MRDLSDKKSVQCVQFSKLAHANLAFKENSRTGSQESSLDQRSFPEQVLIVCPILYHTKEPVSRNAPHELLSENAIVSSEGLQKCEIRIDDRRLHKG